MVNRDTDATIVVSKDLRDRIKIAAAKARLKMRAYLDRLVPKE